MKEIINDKIVFINGKGKKITKDISKDMIILYKNDTLYNQWKWIKWWINNAKCVVAWELTGKYTKLIIPIYALSVGILGIQHEKMRKSELTGVTTLRNTI